RAGDRDRVCGRVGRGAGQDTVALQRRGRGQRDGGDVEAGARWRGRAGAVGAIGGGDRAGRGDVLDRAAGDRGGRYTRFGYAADRGASERAAGRGRAGEAVCGVGTHAAAGAAEGRADVYLEIE